MKVFQVQSLFACAILVSYTTAYNLSPNVKAQKHSQTIETNRREALSKFATATLISTGWAFASNDIPTANALEACPPKANNCVRTTWTPPASTSKESAISALKEVLSQYPQEGQDNVDGGGWSYATNDLDSTGLARLEFKSSGKGNFAKFFNGGKPFIDDLKIEVEDSGVVQVYSQSRLGDSDFGVNAKRVGYLAKGLKAMGWSV